MPIRTSSNGDTQQITLEGAVDIGAAAELKAALVEALATAKKTSVALREATEVDVTIFQLLWAAQREAERAGVELSLAGPLPEPVRKHWTTLALSGLVVSE